MSEQTDASDLIDNLNAALPLLARDAVAAAVAAGAVPGPEGVALAPHFRRMAADDVRDIERIAARIASLGGTPAAGAKAAKLPVAWRDALESIAKWQHETLTAVVSAIPADADDPEGEATEHLLEHLVNRKRDDVELVERALR